MPYTATGTFNGPNTFTAQLSDASGSFASPVDIGSVSSTTSGSISCTIPTNTIGGNGYRIRVVSSDPVVTGTDNGSDITIDQPTTWYADTDNDGFGELAVDSIACTQPVGYVADNSDNCPALPGQIGDPCDDGLANTSNDVITASCTCAGTFTPPGGYPTPPGSGIALDFDGVNDKVVVPDAPTLDGATAFSLETWVLFHALSPSGTAQDQQPIISKWFSSGVPAENSYLLTETNGNLNFSVSSGTAGSGISYTGHGFSTGTWYHVAGTFDAGTMKLYVNGIEVASGTLPVTSLGNGTQDLKLGDWYHDNNTSYSTLHGRLDETRIWIGAALTEAEIRDHLCKKDLSAHPQLASLAAYFRYDDGTGTQLLDISGQGNHGTLTNMDPGTDWVLSGAPIGDLSAHTYGGSTITLTDGTSFTADNYTGSPVAVHVYKVNEAPNNVTVPSGFTALETSEYYGVHVIGGTNPQYSATWNYSGNVNVDGASGEADARLAKRNDNADATWAIASAASATNTGANTIVAANQNGTEFSIGFMGPVPPCADGTYDLTFTPGSGAEGTQNTVASLSSYPLPDGRAIVAGYFTSYDGAARNRIVRINADGTVDPTFNPGSGANSWIGTTAIQPDGKILIGGDFTTYDGVARNRIARLNADGTLDAGFNPGSGLNNRCYALALQPDGKVVVVGNFTSVNGTARNRVARLNADGSLDAGFNPGTASNNTMLCVAMQADGKVLIGGDMTSFNGTARNYVARLNTDGSLDASFNAGAGPNGQVSALAVQADGNVLLGGTFTTVNGTGRNRVARVTSTGALDASFDPGTGADNKVRGFAVLSDSRIFMVGDFTTYNGVATASRFVRLLGTGGLDPAFDDGNGGNGDLYCLNVLSDGRVLIGGSLTTYDGIASSGIARVGQGVDTDGDTTADCADGCPLDPLKTDPGTCGCGVADTDTDGDLTADCEDDCPTDPLKTTPGICGCGTPETGDTDGDGLADCVDNCPALFGQIGDPCDDGIASTSGDVITASCSCTGTFTVPGGYPTPPGSGVALDFDGVNDRVTLPLNMINTPGSGAITIEYWLRSTVTTSQPMTYSIEGMYISRVYPDGSITVTYDGTTVGSQQILAGLNDGKWHHVAGVHSGGNTSVYVDGSLVGGQAEVLADIDGLNRSSAIGSQYDGIDSPFAGRIDEFRIWNGVALTQAEIRDHLCKKDLNAHPQLAGLEAYYRFDDGSGTVLQDISGHGHHGTLTNMDAATDWVTSGAPLGDLSAHTYGGSTVTLTDGTSFTADTYTGSPAAVHVYKVNEAPNNTAPPTGLTSLETSEYFGVHVIGGTNPQYSATWDYSGNGAVDGQANEGDARLAKRDDNADATWALGTTPAGTNTTANTITATAQSGTEYIIGFTPSGAGCDPASYDFSYLIGNGANAAVRAIAVQPDGKAVVAGDFTSFDGTAINRMVRLTPDGIVDGSFNAGLGPNVGPSAVAVQPDGKIIIGGAFTSVNGTTRNRIARLNADGTLDATFNPGSGANDFILAVVLQPDGKVLVGGNFTTMNGSTRNRIARLNADGSLDGTFNPGTGPNDRIERMVLQPNGAVLVSGQFTSISGTGRSRVARLTATGGLDATFNPGTGANSTVSALALQPDGKVLIGGSFTTFNGTGRNRIARLNANGSLDTGFNPGTGVDAVVRWITVQVDGRALIGGDFTTYNGTARGRYARVLTTGGLDTSYDPGAGASSSLLAIALQDDGRALIGGSLTSYNGVSTGYLARVNGDPLSLTAVSSTGPFAPPSALTVDYAIGGCGYGAGNTFSVELSDASGSFASPTVIGTVNSTASGSIACSIPFGTPAGTGYRVRVSSSSPAQLSADNGVDLVILQPYPEPPGSGVALDFDGTNDYVRFTTPGAFDPGTGSFTTEAWIRFNVSSIAGNVYPWQKNGGGGVAGGAGGAESDFYSLYFTASGYPRWYLRDAAGTQQFFTYTQNMLDQQWHHYACVRDVANARMQLYIDGFPVIDEPLTVLGDIAPANDLFLCAYEVDGATTFTGFFPGRMDEFRYWSAALTEAEIRDHLCKKDLSAHPQLANLAAYYRFDDGTGTTLQDISGNGHHGTLTNMDPGTDWVTSGAPLGDRSAHTYGGSTVTLTDGTSFTADNYTGNPAAVHVYKVNEAPNATTAPSGFSTLETSEYYGVHLIGGTAPQYSATWTYSGNANVDGASGEADARLAKRDDNADATWTRATTPDATDAGANTITAHNQHGTEYIVGFNSYAASCNAGTYDLSFTPGDGTDGTIRTVMSVNPYPAPDGRMIAAGYFNSYDGIARNGVVRIHPDGTLDHTFNPGSGTNSFVLTSALQPDGKVLIGGDFTSVNGVARNRIARLNADGSVDTGFNPGTGLNNRCYAMALQPDGKVVIVGNFTTVNGTARNRVARLNADGTLDTGFNPGTASNNTLFSVVLQPDGKVLIGGDLTSFNGTTRNYIARLNTNGSLDTGFNGGTGPNGRIAAIAYQPDGNIVIGGGFTAVNGTGRNRVARVTSTGALDGAFNPGTGVNAQPRAIALAPDGRVYLAGDFTTCNGTPVEYLVRMLGTGGPDPNFNDGTGSNAEVYSLALLTDGRLLVGGALTSYDGIASSGIARVMDGGLAITALSSTGPFTPPAALTVDYAAYCAFGAGNTFSVELSDASGSFASPTVIGTVNSTASGSIACTIPGGTPAGTGYRVRVTSSSPSQLSADNGVDIEIQAPYPTPPGSGIALDLDGVNDKVIVPDDPSLDNTSTLTLETWVLFHSLSPGSASTQRRSIINKYYSSGGFGGPDRNSYFIHEGNGALNFGVAAPGTDVFAISYPGHGFTTEKWYHVAGTFDNGLLKLYIDGTEVLSGNAPFTTIANGSENLKLGDWYKDYDPNYSTFHGRMDEVRIWRAALTQSEIRDHLCKKDLSAHPQLANLAAYYRFDDGSGTVLQDISGNGNHGTLTNMDPGTDWVTSGAPIGDLSAHTYGGGSITLTDGTSFTADSYTGSPAAVHVYKVNEAPNDVSLPNYFGSLETSEYYGVHVIGGSAPTYTGALDYSANANIEGQPNEASARLARRANNAAGAFADFGPQGSDNTANTLTATNQTGTEYIAGFSSLPPYPTPPGSGVALDFDGVNDRVVLPSTTALTNTAYTYEAWIQRNELPAIPADGETIWDGVFSPGNSFTHVELSQGGTLRYLHRVPAGAAGGVDIYSSTNMTDGTWHHIAAVYGDDGLLRIYIDGNLEATSVTTAPAINAPFSGLLGMNNNNIRHFIGHMDEVRLWSVALTQSEIRDHLCKKDLSAHPQLANLAAYYRFDDGSGTLLQDISGNGNHGTLTNMDPGTDWVTSGAPIGDLSAHTYGGSSITLTDGTSFTADTYTGSPAAVHVYKVNEAPNNVSLPNYFGSLETSEYYGVHVIGGTAPTYTGTLDYSANANIEGQPNEGAARLASRADNAAGAFTDVAIQSLSTTANTIVVPGQTGTEYVPGFLDLPPYPYPPGSGMALDFDGVDDRVQAASSLAFERTQPFSIECWTRFVALDGRLISNLDMSGNLTGYELIENNGELGFYLVNSFAGNNYLFAKATTATPLSTWTHIAVTYDGSSNANGVTFYVNGVALPTTVVTNTLSASTLNAGPFCIGARNNNTQHFDGRMDEIRIWSVALSQTEIRDHLCKKDLSGHPQLGNLDAYYRLDDGSGDLVQDISGNGNHATLTNMDAGTDWVTSGAPLGDLSAHTYSGSAVTLTDGTSFTADNFFGTVTAAHVYKVNEAPNVLTAPAGLSSLLTTSYHGVFFVGDPGSNYRALYDYANEAAINGTPGERQVRSASRVGNADPVWGTPTGWAQTNVTENWISSPKRSESITEYIPGFDTEIYPEPPGSGNCLWFDGVDNYVNAGLLEWSLENEPRISFWMRPSGGGSYPQTIVRVGPQIKLQRTSSTTLQLTGTGGSASFSSGPTGWVHVSLVFQPQSGNLRIYLNGLTVSGSTVGLTPTGSGAIRIGANSGNEFLRGHIDEFKVYEQQLNSLTVLREHMCSKTPDDDPWIISTALPRRYYRFDEAPGAPATSKNLVGWPDAQTADLIGFDLTADRHVSGAPLGDTSTYTYTSTSLALLDGTSFNLSSIVDGGTGGSFIYKVNEAPNDVTVPSGFSAIEPSAYYGVYIDGAVQPGFNAQLNYTTNNGIDGQPDEGNVRLLYRLGNSTGAFQDLAPQTTNAAANTIDAPGQTHAPNRMVVEYIPGFINLTELQFQAPLSASVAETIGSTDLTLEIASPSGSNAASVDVVLLSGDAARIGNYSTQTVNWPAGDATTKTVTITVTDNAACDGDEVLVFELQNASGGTNAAVGSNNQFTLTVTDEDALVDTDSDGTADCDDGCPNDPNKTWEGICGCGNPDVDSDGDSVMDCLDGCPNDPLKFAPGICGCGIPDVDTDGDAIVDCLDGCPLDPNKTDPGICGCGSAEPGAACDDGNPLTINDAVNSSCQCLGTPVDCAGVPFGTGYPGTPCDDGDPSTINDTWDNSCTCTGTPTTCPLNNVELVLQTDANGAETSWELIPLGGGVAVCSGSGYAGSSTLTLPCCLDDGCYQLMVYDAMGDGLCCAFGNGGYVLRLANGDRIIDNAADGAFSTTSTLPNGNGFCLPLGTDGLVPWHCDVETWLPGDFIQAQPNPAVQAEYGTGTQADDGYQFWLFDPDGTYNRRVFYSHANASYLFPAGPDRCSYLRFSNLTTLPIPNDLLLNVRVRSRVNGIYAEFGPACRFKIDVAGQCPQTQLVDDLNAPTYSCGVIRSFGGSDKIFAEPVGGADRYRFRFEHAGSGFVRTIATPSAGLQLRWLTLPLQDGLTYDVTVAISFDQGASYCPYGPACPVSIDNTPGAAARMAPGQEGGFRIWPNPNPGDLLYLSLHELPVGSAGVGLEIFDSFGKLVVSRTIATQEGTLNTVIALDRELAAGLYLVNITAGDRTLAQRLVIQ